MIDDGIELPMGVELLHDEVIICNHKDGTVNFYNIFSGEMTLQLPGQQSQTQAYGVPPAPKKFIDPACATGSDLKNIIHANDFKFVIGSFFLGVIFLS